MPNSWSWTDPDFDEHVQIWKGLFAGLRADYPNAPDRAIMDRALTMVFPVRVEERFNGHEFDG